MAQQMIALGNSPDGADGDDARTAFTKTNENFTELYQGIGATQPASPKLSAIAASVWAANQLLIATGADTIGTLATGATGRALVAANNAAEGRSAIAAQTAHANLTGLSSIPSAPSRVPFFISDAGEMGYFDSTSFARDFAGAVDATSARSKLGLGTAALGTVTVSAGDAGAGRILKNGDWGVGATNNVVTVGDLNVVAAGGIRRITPDTSNRPNGLSYGNVLDMMYEKSSENWTQLVASMVSPKAWIRSRINNALPATAEIYTTANTVGSVSQSGGVPTGAIMEKGQNAQGFYLRFADGTQLAWGEIGSSTLGAGTVTSTTVTFPIAFYMGAGAPVVSSNFQPQLSWDVYGPISNGVVSTTQVSITIRNGATAQSGTIRWSAVGRWY